MFAYESVCVYCESVPAKYAYHVIHSLPLISSCLVLSISYYYVLSIYLYFATATPCTRTFARVWGQVIEKSVLVDLTHILVCNRPFFAPTLGHVGAKFGISILERHEGTQTP